MFHVGRDKFRVKSFAADSTIVNDASRHIHTAATRHRVRKIAPVRHKASYSLPTKFVSGPLCRVRRCVCTHQVHPDDTCFVSHIKHSGGRNFSKSIDTASYCYSMLGFVRFRAPSLHSLLHILLHFCRLRIGFSYEHNRQWYGVVVDTKCFY